MIAPGVDRIDERHYVEIASTVLVAWGFDSYPYAALIFGSLLAMAGHLSHQKYAKDLDEVRKELLIWGKVMTMIFVVTAILVYFGIELKKSSEGVFPVFPVMIFCLFHLPIYILVYGLFKVKLSRNH